MWGVGHKWLQTIVVVSVCKECTANQGRVLKGAPQFWDMVERGATVAADVCLSGVVEQKVEIFCLLGFVENRRQMCFSHGSLSCFFLHMRVLREEGNRGGKRSKRENNNDKHPTLGLFFHSSYNSSTSSFN